MESVQPGSDEEAASDSGRKASSSRGIRTATESRRTTENSSSRTRTRSSRSSEQIEPSAGREVGTSGHRSMERATSPSSGRSTGGNDTNQADTSSSRAQRLSKRPDSDGQGRTSGQKIARLAALYVVPLLLVIPISLSLSLTKILLTPLYNSIPLTLHSLPLYAFYTLITSLLYWYSTRDRPAKENVSARVCVCLAALGGDIVSVGGRKTGSNMGRYLGGRLGAVCSRGVLGLGIVGGGTAFALLCFDHIAPIKPSSSLPYRIRNFAFILARSAFYLAHIWYGEKTWDYLLSGSTSALVQRPEKSMLFLSLILTGSTWFLRPSPSTTSISTQIHSVLTTRFKLDRKAQKSLAELTSRLPSQFFPLLLAVRLPLLVLAIREQIFLHPPTPYLTANNTLRVLSSERSLTGQIVVAEDLKNGYRFLRCDHSLLGGRWIREVPMPGKRKNSTKTEMGDSIFSTFALQEVGLLAHRSDPSDSLTRTIALTTDLEVQPEGDEQVGGALKADERVLIIGLGVGVAASAFAKRGYEVDVVEIDPSVYKAASDHFGLNSRPMSTVNLISGSTYVHQLAEMRRSGEYNGTQWSFVVQDCYSGGSLPAELFTREFWQDLTTLVHYDGIVAMNFFGLLHSRAAKAVLVTLLSVFEQCRAFGDSADATSGSKDPTNMVVLCTMASSPLLTFRIPVAADVMRSPLRSHVYSTFLRHEIQLDSIVSDRDRLDPALTLLRDNATDLDIWQVDTALATWKGMQQLLTREVWLAW